MSPALAGEFLTTRPLSPRGRLKILYLAERTLSEILIPRPRACPSLPKQLVPGRLGAAPASVLTGYPWPSGPGESSGHTGRTSCCRHGSGPRGRAPGARFLRGEEDAVTAQRVAGTPSLQVSTGPSGGEVPRAAAPASFPGRVPSQEVHPHPDPRPRVAQIPVADREGQPHPSPGS